MKKVLITGVSSGLGWGLARVYLNQGWEVYGISRRVPEDLLQEEAFQFLQLDLTDYEAVQSFLPELLDDEERLDLVILNAGILGEIKDLKETGLQEIQEVMDANLWSNKILMDEIFKLVKTPQLITISSGASVNGNRGWGAYSISKAALNMLTKLYAEEIPDCHFTALAPGLIDTAMQDYLCEVPDITIYSAIEKLKKARNTPNMPQPLAAAEIIISRIPDLLKLNSGSFQDIRDF